MTESTTPISAILEDDLRRKMDKTFADMVVRRDRAGIMATVIVTILGIGVPILLQPATRGYFHKLPLVYLLISFFVFYIVFIKYAPISIDLDMIHKNEEKIYQATPYQKSLLERVIGWTYSPKERKSNLATLLNRIDIRSLGLSRWGHAFFLSAVILEVIEVVYKHINTDGLLVKCLLALFVLLAVRFWLAYSPRYTFTLNNQLRMGGK